MKLIIAGSRGFNDYELLKKEVDAFVFATRAELVYDCEIVSGCANGADKLGENYANDNGLYINKFPADWNKHGKSAGYIRNEEMAKFSTHCICFWDGKSKGTKHMIDLSIKYGLILRVIQFQQNNN